MKVLRAITLLYIFITTGTIFLLGCLIIKILEQMIKIGAREWKYLIIPLGLLILIGWLAHILQFTYSEQFVIASGAIYSACIALYISKSTEFHNQVKEEKNKQTQLEHVITMAKKGIDVITREQDNYSTYIDQIKKVGLGQTYLKTTPFYFLEQTSTYDQGSLYSSIISSKKSEDSELRKSYINFSQQVKNSLFIKENATKQFIIFNEAYNKSANELTNGMLSLNEVYTKIGSNPVIQFERAYSRIIDNFNAAVHNQTIDYFSPSDLMTNLFTPLLALLQNLQRSNQYVPTISQALKICEVNLNKMEEIRDTTIEHYGKLRDDLEEIKTKLQKEISILE